MSRLKRLHNVYPRNTARVTPTYVASNTAQPASGASITLAKPTGLAVGDCMFVAVAVIASATITPSSGFVKVLDSTPDAGVRLHLYLKFADSSDVSTSNFVFTTSATGEASCAVISAYRGVGGWSAFPQSYMSNSTEVINNRPRRIPSQVAGPNDLVVAVAGTYSGGALGNTSAAIGNPSAGWNLAAKTSIANNALVLGRGVAMFHKPGGNAVADTYATTNTVHNTAHSFVLSPVNPRLAEMDRNPSSLASKPVHVIGTSSSAYVPHPSTNWGYNTRAPWGVRVQRAFGTGGTNYSMPGSRAADICTYIYGNESRDTESVQFDPLTVNRVGTWNVANSALVLTDLIGNDIISSGSTAQAKAGVEHAVRSIFSLLGSNAAFAYSHGTVNATGWTNVSSAGLMYGAACYHTTPGATVTVTPGKAGKFHVILIGADNASAGNNGASYNIKVDGVSVKTGTTHNQMKSTAWGANWGYVQMAIPVTITNAASVITIEHTGSSGHTLMFNGYLEADETRNVVVTNCLGEMPAAAYSTYGFTLALQEEYQTILKSVAAEFRNVIVYDPKKALLLADGYSSDYVHQNEVGHAIYARDIFRRINECHL